MKVVNVHEAKTSLSALLAEVERGAEIVIARNGYSGREALRLCESGGSSAGRLATGPGVGKLAGRSVIGVRAPQRR